MDMGGLAFPLYRTLVNFDFDTGGDVTNDDKFATDVDAKKYGIYYGLGS